jgi:HAD superfamily hydrolase (TIGR01509 family)
MTDRIELPEAILFDMDGTLTAPVFDFPAVRRAMGIPAGEPILEYLNGMPLEERSRAEVILHQIEDDIAATAPLADRCGDLMNHLERRGVKLALITRNRRDSVKTFLQRHRLAISVCISREDCPHKPDPAGLLMACERLGARPASTWMVGDGQYDVEAGNNAGMKSIWLHHGRKREFAAEPWLTVKDLCELEIFIDTLAQR